MLEYTTTNNKRSWEKFSLLKQASLNTIYFLFQYENFIKRFGKGI